ncbi:MAG: ABC transporter permease [Rhodospirillales bacterium]|nr:ABC transporter permease [Rhodospirillales bacterium]
MMQPALLRRSETVIFLVIVAAMIGIGLVNPAFWQLGNLFSLLRANIVTGIMALGVLTVMISGGIDVSFPAFAMMAMYVTLLWMLDGGHGGVALPFAMATAIGLALGALNAFFVHTVRMIPLIVTLGTGALVRGFLLGFIGTSNINIDRMPPQLIDFAKTDLLVTRAADGGQVGLTAMLLIYLGFALLVHLLLTRTMIGRAVFAIGGDKEAARRVGFNIRRTTFFVYCLAGALAGFTGLLHVSMIWLANPHDLAGMELDVIAAVVLGGASIFGGRGSVLGTMLGVFMLVMVNNSLIIMHISTTWQRVVVGGIVIGATAITAWRDRARLA